MFAVAKDLSQSVNEFTQEISSILDTQSANRVFSGLSVAALLNLVSIIAIPPAKEEILRVLKTVQFTDLPCALKAIAQECEHKKEGLRIHLTNSIWPNIKLQLPNGCFDPIKELVSVTPVDFSTNGKDIINQFVAQETNNLIPQLLSNVSADTKYILVNTLYFRGRWVNEFSPARPGPFFSFTGQSNKQLMHAKENYGYFEDNQCQMLRAMYQGNRHSAIFILPKDKTPAGLEKCLFSPQVLHQNIVQLRSEEVIVTLPRFKVETTWEDNLVSALTKLGIKILFNPSCVSLPGDGYAESIIQKAVIIVNEKETEAAAATAIRIIPTCMPKPTQPKVFEANRPFAFLIYDHQLDLILFSGSVTDPTE